MVIPSVWSTRSSLLGANCPHFRPGASLPTRSRRKPGAIERPLGARALEPPGELADPRAFGPERLAEPGDRRAGVVGHAAQLELAPGAHERVGRAAVAVERHADGAGVDQLHGPGLPAELDVGVA